MVTCVRKGTSGISEKNVGHPKGCKDTVLFKKKKILYVATKLAYIHISALQKKVN